MPGRLLNFASGIDRTLWLIADGPSLCRAPVSAVLGGHDPGWECHAIPVQDLVVNAVETPSGAVWLATLRSGVLRFEGRGFDALPGSQELPSQQVQIAEPARDDGIWVSGPQYLWRVRERTDLPAGWSVEERLGAFHGVMSDGAFDVLEDEDGTLWATTSAGVIQMPPSARSARPVAARLAVVRATVNGRRVDGSVSTDLPYGRNDVSLEVSAFLFRDPGSVQYRLRLDGGAHWSAPARSSRIQLVDVPPGRHQVEVQASTDGVTWTEPVGLFALAVARPWYRNPWVWVLVVVAIAAAVVLVDRARMAVRLRIEKQRSQIALDLHDELGSGLGSIRVLAGMAARGALDGGAERNVATRIESTARDLGQALTGIVWSLRDGARTLRDLCAHVAERGHELFPGTATAFATEFPRDWPAEILPLAARRNLQLILLEALHNAAKHARGSRVQLGASPEAGLWRLWVEDDGVGIREGAPTRTGGLGLPGMRERAAEIGARLTVGPAAGSPSGTRVEIALPAPRFAALRLGPGVAFRMPWRTSRS